MGAIRLWLRFGARRALWAVLLFVSWLAAGTASARPNFVVLIADDQRWDALGVVQAEQGASGRFPWLVGDTPNLDRLAAEGFRFRNAFVVSSLCSPSRAALLTGQYNHRNGVANNHTDFPVGNVTFATALGAAGYRTGFFGKWHMGGQAERPGFAEYASYLGQGRYLDQLFRVNGEPRPSTGWIDDVATDYAVDFIRRAEGAPFAMVLAFKSSHGPWIPPARLADRFTDATARTASNLASFPPYDTTPVPAASAPEDIRNYARTIVGIDENVGRVLAALGEVGVLDDTFVVYMSDNGLFIDEHGIAMLAGADGNKRNAYEESIRVPLLIRYPRLGRQGIVLDAAALNIDLAPTILRLAGIAPVAMQGRNLLPLLDGSRTTVRGRFLYEYFRETGYDVPTMTALQRGQLKLIAYPSEPAWTELYDLRRDPYETRNLVGKPAWAAALARMTADLAAEKDKVGYTIPPYADPEP